MADPLKTAKAEKAEKPEETKPFVAPPKDEGEAEVRAMEQARSFEFRQARRGEAVAVLPMGVRVAAPHLQARYNRRNGENSLLGAPQSIVSERFRAAHPGYRYAWPVALNNQTQAFVRSGVYEPVPFSEVDSSNPIAAVSESPEGRTTWMQHILVAISPHWAEQLFDDPEMEAIQRTAYNRSAIENDLNERFGAAGYAGEVEAFADKREERIR